MSQCITFPPLVFSRNQACGQNLVDLTKIERFKTELKKVHRKEKKENKERRKHKRESKGENIHKHSSIKGYYNHKQFSSTKNVSCESELEKSDLTEELEKSQKNLGYLSDGSQNSKKRKRAESPMAVESHVKATAVPVAGNPLRFRLILKKSKAEDAVPPQKDLVCSTSVSKSLNHQDVSTSSVSKISELEKDLVCSTSVAKSLNHQDVITSSVSCSKISEPKKGLLRFTSFAKSLNHQDVIASSASSSKLSELPSTSVAAISETKKKKKHRPSKEDRYNALFDDWNPMPICFVEEPRDDDNEWLFGNKTQVKLNPKAGGKINEDMRRTEDSSWPRAQFLSEVGIHALPYTVPF